MTASFSLETVDQTHAATRTRFNSIPEFQEIVNSAMKARNE